jgi:hypothetical protein
MPRQPSQLELTVAEGTTTQALRLEIGEREGRHSTADRATDTGDTRTDLGSQAS